MGNKFDIAATDQIRPIATTTAIIHASICIPLCVALSLPIGGSHIFLLRQCEVVHRSRKFLDQRPRKRRCSLRAVDAKGPPRLSDLISPAASRGAPAPRRISAMSAQTSGLRKSGRRPTFLRCRTGARSGHAPFPEFEKVI
jgi:hypothetical protein